jgi:hypothetical protein
MTSWPHHCSEVWKLPQDQMAETESVLTRKATDCHVSSQNRHYNISTMGK